MALSWRTLDAMPRLRSYAAAVQHEASVKPIRGRKPEVKPLGRRKQSWWEIKREKNGDILVLGGPDLVLRYRPDDTLLVYDPGYWNKSTYNDVIGTVAGVYTQTEDRSMWASTDGGKHLVRPSPKRRWVDGKHSEPTEPLPENIFKRVEKVAGNRGYLVWSYVNPPALTTHYIKRKQMREVRERYAAFTAYATALDSIREKHPQPAEYKEHFNITFERWDNTPHHSWYNPQMPPAPHNHDFKHRHAAEVAALMLSEDATDMYKAYLWLNVRRDWQSSNTTAAGLIDRVILMHHHAEVLAEREVTAGKVSKDRYAWAIPTES